MNYLFDWTPEEWKLFCEESKEKSLRILADETLFKCFDECLQERIAVAEENGCPRSEFPLLENTLDIIWRNNFV